MNIYIHRAQEHKVSKLETKIIVPPPGTMHTNNVGG